MPVASWTVTSWSALISRTARWARSRVWKGWSAVPAALSSPVGETAMMTVFGGRRCAKPMEEKMAARVAAMRRVLMVWLFGLMRVFFASVTGYFKWLFKTRRLLLRVTFSYCQLFSGVADGLLL